MKCPKCNYLGFETGDRCRNCGYDFSLISHGDPRPVDLDLELRSTHAEAEGPSDWLIRAEATLPTPRGLRNRSEPFADSSLPDTPDGPHIPNVQNVPNGSSVPIHPAVSASKPKLSRRSKLPLFQPAEKADEPLIRLPVIPRPPLAVRRTPDSPRLQVVSRAVRAVEREPALEFDTARATPQRDVFESDAPPPVARTSTQRSHDVPAKVPVALSGPLTRVVAATIDHVLLLAIDAGVIYFTLRIAGLSMGEWGVLPVLPLFAFLLLLKFAYFSAFTAVGGQTIGKMALRIRVVSEDNGAIDANLALRRTVVGAASTACFGLGMLPAFFDPQRRAFHDRVTRTRVVGLRTP